MSVIRDPSGESLSATCKSRNVMRESAVALMQFGGGINRLNPFQRAVAPDFLAFDTQTSMHHDTRLSPRFPQTSMPQRRRREPPYPAQERLAACTNQLRHRRRFELGVHAAESRTTVPTDHKPPWLHHRMRTTASTLPQAKNRSRYPPWL